MTHLTSSARQQLSIRFLLAVPGGCANSTMRNNLDTGEVFDASCENRFTGYGQITVTTQDALPLHDEYTQLTTASTDTTANTRHCHCNRIRGAALGFYFKHPNRHYTLRA